MFGKIDLRGLVECFEPGLVTDSGDPVYCETSAVVFEQADIVLASDKPVPGCGRSAVLRFPYAGSGPVATSRAYLTEAPFLGAVKYEDMTLTPDGKHVIATTGFDRVKPGSHEWDGFDTLMFWPIGQPDKVKVAAATTAGGVTSSVSLRKPISQALRTAEFPQGVPYFKVEGLAAVPGHQLLFGIREMGASYQQFHYTFKLLSVSYQIAGDELVLGNDFRQVYDFDAATRSGGRHASALSSVEYDRYHDRLYLLSSFEEANADGVIDDEGLGGYLWVLPMAHLHRRNLSPTAVLEANGEPLLFAHKPEGITVLSDSQVLVVHDDDRVLGRGNVTDPRTQFSRLPNQGAYSLVSIEVSGVSSR